MLAPSITTRGVSTRQRTPRHSTITSSALDISYHAHMQIRQRSLCEYRTWHSRLVPSLACLLLCAPHLSLLLQNLHPAQEYKSGLRFWLLSFDFQGLGFQAKVSRRLHPPPTLPDSIMPTRSSLRQMLLRLQRHPAHTINTHQCKACASNKRSARTGARTIVLRALRSSSCFRSLWPHLTPRQRLHPPIKRVALVD